MHQVADHEQFDYGKRLFYSRLVIICTIFKSSVWAQCVIQSALVYAPKIADYPMHIQSAFLVSSLYMQLWKDPEVGLHAFVYTCKPLCMHANSSIS